MSGPPELTEVQVSAGHAALAITPYAINPNIATLARHASMSMTARTATSSVEETLMFGGIGGYSLANTTIGATVINHGAGSFRAERSLAVSSVRTFFQAGAGYSAGDGGIFTASIFPDNGSGNPDIAATPLAQKTGIVPGTGSTVGYLITFTGGTALVEGNLYHFVLENTHASRTTNYHSMNSIQSPSGSPYHWRWSTPADYRHQYRRTDTGVWVTRTAFALVMEVTYSDGHGQGNSYMEMSYSTVPSEVASIYAASSRMVRQAFTTPYNATALSAGIKLQKATGTTGALTIALRDTGSGRGTLLQSQTVAASEIPDGTMSGTNLGSTVDWATVDFSPGVSLSASTAYRLEFSTTGDGQYMSWPIRRGTDGFSYTEDTAVWPSGQAQYSTDNGSTWSDISGSNDDLQSFLVFQPIWS